MQKTMTMRQARRVAELVKDAKILGDLNGPVGQRITQQYEALVKEIGYDPYA